MFVLSEFNVIRTIKNTKRIAGGHFLLSCEPKFCVKRVCVKWVPLYFHNFRKWLRIHKILSANFPEELENGSHNCLCIGRFTNNRAC